MRKAHSSWDRTCREWTSTYESSESYPNTQGCKIEKDLKAMCEKGKSIDKQIQSLEQLVLRGINLDYGQIQEAQRLCSEMADLIKTGNAKNNGIKSLMKLSS